MKSRIMLVVAAALMIPGCNNAKKVEKRLAEFTAWNETFMQDYRTRIMSLQEDPEAAEAYADSAYEAYMDYNKAALEKNLDNAVGVEALKAIYSDLENEDLAMYLGKLNAPLHGEDSAFVAALKVAVDAKSATAEGKMFTDFEVGGVKFSDFIGKGKYVLVDFWASWCGPCRREMPNIRAVYDEFHGEDFDVLSVAVWDKLEATQAAAKEENITWNQIMDAQKIPTEIYGIQGIPHIILFGPDGTILRRGLRGEQIREAVKDALDR